ncbi:hypothetical protein H4F17_17330 [Vibrio cholerae]
MKLHTLGLLSLFASAAALANPEVTSREYKLMLEHQRFQFSTEAEDVARFVQELESVIRNSIDRPTSDAMTLKKQRSVSFYDVPGECTLNANGYSYRERVDSKSSVSLKFRSPDRYIVGFDDVTSNEPSAKSKMELDVSANRHNTFRAIYSASTKFTNHDVIDSIGHINQRFSGFADRYALSDALPLKKVGNLTIYERVYSGLEVDLGKFDAEFDLTLWYLNQPRKNEKPVVAEISFSYEDDSASYSRKVVHRSKALFEAMQGMKQWVATDSITKTAYVYNFDPTFCGK